MFKFSLGYKHNTSYAFCNCFTAGFNLNLLKKFEEVGQVGAALVLDDEVLIYLF